ncbi:hypothetical protein CMI37_32055 [Candidatus Pacearchaeota archaeon]|nr:hypothetical protein [Candidatus Pacearchaeota archaeon]|tara:strand:- start:1554 stop:1763 length:210 start_codon:yes stop_codon:yes gene_type:complete
MGPVVLKQLKAMRLELLGENKQAENIIQKLAELFSVRGDDGVAFSKRLDLRQDLRSLLTDLDCGEDLSA